MLASWLRAMSACIAFRLSCSAPNRATPCMHTTGKAQVMPVLDQGPVTAIFPNVMTACIAFRLSCSAPNRATPCRMCMY